MNVIMDSHTCFSVNGLQFTKTNVYIFILLENFAFVLINILKIWPLSVYFTLTFLYCLYCK
uniref:Uncharacterized protein n=1 Tax=Anguilla anguilla TaxID=7936 RepID=A0A0E9PF68_ANGAN